MIWSSFGRKLVALPGVTQLINLFGFGSGVLTFLQTPSSANLAAALTDETGTGTVVFSSAIREKLTGNRTYYVRTDGSDSNTGLVDSAGGAFLTLQKAVDVVLGTLDLGGYDVTIDVGNGTYTAGILFDSPQVGAGNITLSGDTTTPSNVHISLASGVPIKVDGAGCRLFVQGVKLTSTTGGAGLIVATSSGFVRTTGLNEYGSCGQGHRLYATQAGVIECLANETVSGTAVGAHYRADAAGVIYTVGPDWTASGTATQASFANATMAGVITAFANVSSGTFTGARYSATLNGVIQSNGGGASYFPGNSAGSTATGGQYA